MKQKVFSYLKKIPTFFGLIFLLTLSIFSFSSYFSSEDFSAFSKAVSETPDALYETRMILGCKNELASDYVVRDIKIKHNDGVVPYRVGINNESFFFKCGETLITPIESNSLRYYWSDEIYNQSLIQDIRINFVNDNNDFESNEFNVVVSSSFYSDNNKPKTLKVYSSVVNKTFEFNVVGYYADKSDKYKTITQMFHEIYQEPAFFSTLAFEQLINYEDSSIGNYQTDLIFSTQFNYFASIGSVMSKRNWKKNFVRYSQFNDIYSKMDSYVAKSKMHFAIIGGAAFLAFTLVLFVLIKFFPAYFASLFQTVPYIATVFMFLPLFGFYLFLKFFKGGQFFIVSSFGITISIIIISLVVYTVLYVYKKRGSNGIKN